MEFEDAYFCYPGFKLVGEDKCEKQSHKHRRSINPNVFLKIN